MEQKFGKNSIDIEALREFCEREGKEVTYRKGDRLEREAIISNADTGNQIIHDAEHATRVYRLWERNPWLGE